MSFVNHSLQTLPTPPTVLVPLHNDIPKGRPTSVINAPRTPRLPAGTGSGVPTIPGYDVLTLVGCGGMGIVFKARQQNLNRIVALKTLRGAAFADEETRIRFQNEAEVVARLQHPNIVQLFEIGSVESTGSGQPTPFIALEYVGGGSLVQQTDKPQVPRTAAEMVVKLARAVEVAHGFGVVHRDLKPANVLLTRDGVPKIADFGLAKQLSSESDITGRFHTQAGMIVGTPEYMAPEQAAGAKPTPAVDIYALGIIFYELLTARVPFQGSTPIETMDFVRHEDLVSPRQLQPSLPRDLETICLKCLEKDPQRRYHSAGALADDLQRFLDHRPILARRVGAVGKACRWGRRNPAASISFACIASIILLAFAAVTASYWEAEKSRQDAVEKTQAAELESYQANIAATANALQVYNVESARLRLDAAPERLRNWEWNHFQSRLDLSKYVADAEDTIPGHTRISPSGRYAIRNSKTNYQVIWDTVNRREIARRRSSLHPVLCIGESAIAQLESEYSVSIDELATGKRLSSFTSHNHPIDALLTSGDGERIATLSVGRNIRIWNASDGRLIREIVPRTYVSMGGKLSHDGRLLAVDQDGGKNMSVWEVDTGRQLSGPFGHDRGLIAYNFNRMGDRLLTVEAYPNNCSRLWNTSTGELVATLSGHRNEISGNAFSPDGKFVATSALDQTVRVWNGVTGAPIATLRGHSGRVTAISFRSDGKRIASASADHTIRIWEVPTGDPIAVLPGHLHEVIAVRYTSDGGIISAAQDGKLRLWDARMAEGDELLRGHKSFVYGVAFHPDSERIASASWDSTARIWDANSGKELAVLDHEPKAIVTSVAFHPRGKILASRDRDSVRLWDVDSHEELHRWKILNGGWKDTRIVFNRQGTLLATGCEKFEARIWDVETRELVAVLGGHKDEIRDVAFSPDGRILAVATDGGDRRIHIWDISRKERICTLDEHRDSCYAVAFNREGTLLASASMDTTVRLWSTSTWEQVGVLPHDVPIYGVSFSPDGSRLATACSDSSLRLWDPISLRTVAEMRGRNQYYHQVVFSPDGTRIIVACGDCNVRVWDTILGRKRASQR